MYLLAGQNQDLRTARNILLGNDVHEFVIVIEWYVRRRRDGKGIAK